MVLGKIKYIFIFLFMGFSLSSTFKNVTVLDIESRAEMKKYMKSISKDLGVRCSHCHDMEDKSLDTPVKDITREMIKLTRYLNSLLNTQSKDSLDSKTYATCWTCHHWQVIPENVRPEDN